MSNNVQDSWEDAANQDENLARQAQQQLSIGAQQGGFRANAAAFQPNAPAFQPGQAYGGYMGYQQPYYGQGYYPQYGQQGYAPYGQQGYGAVYGQGYNQGYGRRVQLSLYPEQKLIVDVRPLAGLPAAATISPTRPAAATASPEARSDYRQERRESPGSGCP